MTIIVHYRQ